MSRNMSILFPVSMLTNMPTSFVYHYIVLCSINGFKYHKMITLEIYAILDYYMLCTPSKQNDVIVYKILCGVYKNKK